MGAFTKKDVIDTLSEPIIDRICIYAEGQWIFGTGFRQVKTNIEIGKITVVEGEKSNAYYNKFENKLTTQLGISPPGPHEKALILHECTHALFDVYKFEVSQITNEVLCYITQHLYLLLKTPGYSSTVNKALDPVSQDYLWSSFYASVLDFAKKGVSAPLIINTEDWQFKSLRNHLRTLNIYQHLEESTRGQYNGV